MTQAAEQVTEQAAEQPEAQAPELSDAQLADKHDPWITPRLRERVPRLADAKDDAPEAEAAPEELEAEAKPDTDEPEAEAEAAEAEDKPERTDEEKLSRGFASLKRQKKQIAQREREIKRQAEMVAQREAEQAADAKLRAEDPYKWAHKHGISIRALAEHDAKQDEPEEKKRLRELEATLQEERAAREALEQRLASEAATSAVGEARAKIHSTFSEGATEYPFLAVYEPAHIVDAAWAYLSNAADAQRSGRATEDQEAVLALAAEGHEALAIRKVFGRMEKQLQAQHERLSRVKRTDEPAAEVDSPKRGNGAARTAKPEAKETAPPQATLSNLDASQRASKPRPESRDERKKRAAKLIQFRD